MSHRLSENFATFAESECKSSSPLYHELSHAIVQDDEILEIAAKARAGQPIPNLLFAAVHYLLCFGISHPLRAFYATCVAVPASPTEAYPAFKDFVLSHRPQVISLLESRLVQTNEVRRCSYLFPAIAFAASQFPPRPLALVEIGTSAGLNLCWDRYNYSYGNSAIYGEPASPVHIRSSFQRRVPGILSAPLPRISHRIGLDLNIVDVSVADEAAWLRALIWPEHEDRRTLMDAALKHRAGVCLDLRTGDGFSMLADLAQEIPETSLLCVYHTHVANQVSTEVKESFLMSLEKLGTERDLIHVCNNMKPGLHLTAYRAGDLIDMTLANTDGHARWIEWLPES